MASEAELRYMVTVQDRELRNLRKEVRGLKKDADDTGKGVESGLSKRLDEAGDKMVSTGKKATKGLTLPLIALGTAAFKSFADIEQGENAVTLATGATGKQLDGLHKSYRAALSEGRKFGLTHEQVGQVVGDLNTHFGLQGKRLTDATKDMSAFSRATGVDGAEAVGKVNRVMRDWGVDTEQMPGLLDKLTVAGQKTGVSVDSLMGNVVKFGVPMRNFGFDIDESIALLSSFEQAGVNTELVMGSMRIATGKFAKEGKDLKTGLMETIDAIQNADSSAEAAAIGMEVFGARAGADVAKAIQEGRFEIDDLVAALGNSDGATREVADNTVTASGRMREAWTEAQLALEPLGAAIAENVSRAIQAAVPWIQRIARWFRDLPGPVKEVAKVLGIAAAALGPVLIIGGKLLHGLAALIPVIKGVGVAMSFLAANPIVLVIAAIAALAAGLVLAYRNSETFRAIVHKALEVVGTAASWLWGVMKAAWSGITSATSALWGYIKTAFDAVKKVVETVGATVSWFWSNAVKPAWDAITTATGFLWTQVIKRYFDLIERIVRSVGATVSWLWNNAVKPTWDAISSGTGFLWTQVIKRYFDLIERIVRSVGATAGWLWSNAIKPAWDGITTATNALWHNVISPVAGWISGAVTNVGNTATWLWKQAVKPAFEGVETIVTTFWSGAKGTFDLVKGALDKIGTAAGAMKEGVRGAFAFIRDHVVNPALRTFKAIADGFISVANKIGNGASKISKVISKIPGVDIKFNWGNIQPLAIPALAQGDIIRRPTLAMVGEDGPEAVIPLGAKRRRRGQELMTRAALMMGMPGIDPSSGLKFMAEGGIVAPRGPAIGGRSVADLEEQIKVASKRRGIFQRAFDVLKQGLDAFLLKIPRLNLGSGPWAEAMKGLPGWLWDKTKGMARSLFRAAENSFGTLDIMRAKHESEKIMGRPYGWGAGRPPGWHHSSYDCSGYASTAWWEASGKRGGSGTTMSLFPISKGASGDEPFLFGFRGMRSNDPRAQHMGAKILGDWYQFGDPGKKGGSDGQWTSLRVPPFVPGYQRGTPYVPETGPAMLHKGERVIPADGALVHIDTVNVRNEQDIELTAARLSRKLALGGVG